MDNTFNLKTHIVEEQITAIINGCELPVSLLYYMMQDLTLQVKSLYDKEYLTEKLTFEQTKEKIISKDELEKLKDDGQIKIKEGENNNE